MWKTFSRFVREPLERKFAVKKEKTDKYKKGSDVRRKKNCALVPAFLNTVNKRLSHPDTKKEDDNSQYWKNSINVADGWLDAVGLSSAFAFGFVLSQNLYRKRHNLADFYKRYDSDNIANCGGFFTKCALTQPTELPPSEFTKSNEKLEEALTELEIANNIAVAEVEHRLGLHYMSKKRYKTAVTHFSAASALHNSKASFNLARCYERGLGTKQDFKKAAQYYRTASDLGHSTAMFNLGVFYAHGWGVKSDSNEAKRLIKKAADLGQPNAKAALKLQDNDNPVKPLKEKDDDVSIKNLSNIAKLNPFISSCESSPRCSVLTSELNYDESSACYYTGICYENGIGVTEDMGKARNLYSKAAFGNNSEALYSLAKHYECISAVNENGYERSLVLNLYKMSGNFGHYSASERFKTLQLYQELGLMNDMLECNFSKKGGRGVVVL